MMKLIAFCSRWVAAVALLALLLATAGCSRTRDLGEGSATESAEASLSANPGPTTGVPATEEQTSGAATAIPPAPLAAIVNGDYIFLADYERQVGQYEQALVDSGLERESEEGRDAIDQARKDVLDAMIDSVLIRQGAAAMDVSLSDEEFAAQIATDIEGGGGQASFDEWLTLTGQSRSDYEDMVRELLLSQRVIEVLTTDLPANAEQVHLRQILVDSQESAQEIARLLQEGAEFPTLAQERSQDILSAENGGDAGWLPRGSLPPELEDSAFGLKPGDTSGVIPLEDGYWILQVLGHEAARPLSDEAQADLGLAAFEKWLDALRSAARIERLVGE